MKNFCDYAVVLMDVEMRGPDRFETALVFWSKSHMVINDEISRKTKRTATVIRRGLGEK